MSVDTRLIHPRFPRASCYHPEWVQANASGGANSLWLAEWLSELIDFRPGMRVLDLGCGRGMSSIFLRREFGVQVWGADLWFNPSDNLQRFRDAGVEDGVFPIHVDARKLPFAAEFFDAIVSIDSFMYYGSDDLYLNQLARFVKPGGTIGIAQVGLMKEIEGPVPAHLQDFWRQDQLWCLHSADWWERHWLRSGAVTVERADTLPDGWRLWQEWIRLLAPDNVDELTALEADAGANLGYIRVVGRRREDAVLMDQTVSIPPMPYQSMPLLREVP